MHDIPLRGSLIVARGSSSQSTRRRMFDFLGLCIISLFDCVFFSSSSAIIFILLWHGIACSCWKCRLHSNETIDPFTRCHVRAFVRRECSTSEGFVYSQNSRGSVFRATDGLLRRRCWLFLPSTYCVFCFAGRIDSGSNDDEHNNSTFDNYYNDFNIYNYDAKAKR